MESIRKKDNKRNKNENQSGSMDSDINELWKEFDDKRRQLGMKIITIYNL